MKRILGVLLALGCLAMSNAQLTRPGMWRARKMVSPHVRKLPLQDNARLMAEENGSHGGYQFATPIPFSVSLVEDAFWEVFPDGSMVSSLTIVSEGALSMGLTFEGFEMPEGAELHLVGEEETRGAFTSMNAHDFGNFTTYPLKGSSITLEYFQPAAVKGSPSLKTLFVAHGYKPLAFGDSGACNNNAVCDTGKWANQIRSVGMLLSGFGSRFCSGAMVNNAESNGDQLFLTANHCSVDSADAVMFNYQSPTCTPNQDGPTSMVVGKITVLASNAYSDFTIVRIGDVIPSSWNVYLSGLSADNVAPTSMTGIHHPSGDVKKISYANKAGVPDRWSALEPGNWHWRVTSWDDGTTEPGSSGSPLFDQNQRVVGQLHGGAASCLNNSYDTYGACWASWANGLQKFIDPNGRGVTVVDGINLNVARKF